MHKLHDSHIHLDLYQDISKIVNEVEMNKLYTIAVTNHPKIYDILKAKVSSKYIRIGLGFHPELLEAYAKETNAFFTRLPSAKYVGEIGLDFSKKNTYSRSLQISFFTKTISLCKLYSEKIISVHSRKAEKEILNIIGNDNSNKYIMHWYSGSYRVHKKMVENGFYFSFNHEMLSSKNGVEILLRTPLDKVLLESDGPFTKVRKKTYTPNMIFETINLMAESLNEEKCKIEQILDQNFSRILGCNGNM